LENKWVFRRLQKTGKVCADVKKLDVWTYKETEEETQRQTWSMLTISILLK